MLRSLPDLACSLLAALLFTALASCVSDGGFRAGSTLRSLDNDTFERSDDQYTSGLAVSFVSRTSASFAETPLPGTSGAWLDTHWPAPDHDQRFAILSFAQRMFTPTDLSESELVEDDLPYSAMLYGTLTAGSQSRTALTAFSVSLGWVGPLALGKEVQTTLHDWIGSKRPRGWDHQLKNEPLLNVGFDARRRLLHAGSCDGWGGDLLGGLSASVGNLQSQASLAATVRVGYRVPTNFHMQTPFLAEESLGLRAYDEPAPWSLYAFAGVTATALGNAIYLDGNTFTDSHSVEHDDHVLRSSLGLALRSGSFLATLSIEEATIPWAHPHGADNESYGRIGLSWDL